MCLIQRRSVRIGLQMLNLCPDSQLGCGKGVALHAVLGDAQAAEIVLV